MSEKTKGEQLREELLMNPKNLTETMSEEELKAAYDFCEGYKTFLDAAKTEREAVATAVAMLEKAGYVPFDHAKQYKAGDKVYLNNRGKALIAATLGRRSVAEGVRIGVAHIDSPRLDLKPRPLYEEGEQCFLKTHYYGGIKKYQWTAIPLALHGTIIRKDGSSLSVAIGEEEGDPVFCVTDLLPHLAADQMRKTLAEGIEGEKLNILIGSAALRDDTGSEKVKVAIAKLLFEKYGIVEEDFLSAELCAVPAFKARDLGLDRSMIGAYGHDDRVCAYPILNYGVVVTKSTGARGKAGTNDATAEMMGFARRILDAEHVGWQTGELGKVDQGGGGTVAMYVSQHNIDTVDLGVPVLSMHAPFEVVAKADVYMTYRAMRAFYK